MLDLSKIEVFVFDWSGVISDDRMPVYLANMELLKLYGKPTMEFSEWLKNTKLTAAEFLISQGISIETSKADKLYKEFLDRFTSKGHKPVVYPGTFEVFSFLKDTEKIITILSSHPKENFEKEAKEYKLFDLFDFYLSGVRDKTKELKKICQKLQVYQESVLYIGDTIYDIQAAKKAEVVSGAVTTGYHLKERLEKEKPDIIFENLSEIKTLLTIKLSA